MYETPNSYNSLRASYTSVQVVRREEFTQTGSGKIVPTLNGAWAFVPNPLPPSLDLRPAIDLLARATLKLGEVAGIGRTMANPYLLVRPLQRREAIASSNIEGTVTSFSDLLLLEAGADEKGRPPDTREVLNYVRALEHGLDRVGKLPLSLRLIRELHSKLMFGVDKLRGGHIVPGEFRRDQNWIGGANLAAARFVPPPLTHLDEALDAFEKYLHIAEDQRPTNLVDIALIHYQFEAIHPFPDGNGRVGRLLIPLILCERRVLPQPLVFMSPYLERNRNEYIDRLFEVSRRGDWIGWVSFFLRGLYEQSMDTLVRLRKLQDLQQDYRKRIQSPQRSALLLKLLDALFERPIISIPMAAQHLNVTYRAAQQNIEKLRSLGIVEHVPTTMYPMIYRSNGILAIVNDERVFLTQAE